MRLFWLNLSIIALLTAFLTGCEKPVNVASRSNWMTNYEAARAKAKAEKKMILINFTGSDWCGWCKRLQSEVFNKPAFADYSQANLVLLEVDFPQSKSLAPEQARANEILAQQYRVQGFPTLYLLDSQGRTLGTTGYIPGGAEAFIKELNQMSSNSQSSQTEEEDKTDLRLSGISGAPGNRLALINNYTLATGESAAVKTSQGRVQVRCIAILDDAVILSVEGRSEPLELRLSGRL